jgi:hypothetical protein
MSTSGAGAVAHNYDRFDVYVERGQSSIRRSIEERFGG